MGGHGVASYRVWRRCAGAATGLSRPAIRKGCRELESGGAELGRIHRQGEITKIP